MKNFIYIGFALIILVACTKKIPSSTSSGNSIKHEVIEDGYSQVGTKNYTGSASSVADLSINTPLDIYLKSIAGISVTGSGNSAVVTIHGVSSFVSSNEPLFVVDGVPISGGYSSIYSSLNPNDIKRVSVLKDASSSGIYGSRGANGVVVITLKKNL